MQLLLQNDDYKICEEFDNNGNRYLLCIPNAESLEYKICCSLNDNYLSPGDMLLKASNIYATILKKNKNLVYAHMILDTDELKEAALDNDNPLYTMLLRKILSIIKDAYQVTIKEKLAAISNKLGFVSQNEDDQKFLDWVEINQALPIERINLGNNFSHRVDEFEPELPFIDSSEGGGNLLSGGSNEYANDKPLVKTLKPASNNHGFGNMIMVIITLGFIFAVCIGAAYILINNK